jgi:endonuclease/exonuclease/phosphatase family metal-dependent hydrolase
MTNRELTIATLNLENGKRLDLLPDLVTQAPRLDLLMLQEGKGWDAEGQRGRFQAEGLLGPMGLDRSFMTRSTRGTLHELVFIRSQRIRPLTHFTPDLPDVAHDQIGAVTLLVGGLLPPLTVRSVQWPHWSGDARLNEALRLTKCGAPDACDIIGGDFNSLWPDCETHKPEFEPEWSELPPHKRSHKTLAPGLREPGALLSDRRALTAFAEAGLQSAGCIAGDMTPTVNAKADQRQGGRIDHIVLSPMLAAAVIADSYQVYVSEVGDEASDHRLVSVTLDLSRVRYHVALGGE